MRKFASKHTDNCAYCKGEIAAGETRVSVSVGGAFRRAHVRCAVEAKDSAVEAKRWASRKK